MIAVDTSALVAIGLGEPERVQYLSIIRDSPKALVSTVSVVEARMVMFGRLGISAVVMIDDFLGLRRFEITPPSRADMDAALTPHFSHSAKAAVIVPGSTLVTYFPTP